MKEAKDLEQRIFSEQLSLLNRQYPVSAVSGFLVSLIVAYTFWGKLPSSLLLGWMTILHCNLVAGGVVNWRHRYSLDNFEKQLRWYKQYLTVLALIGMSWGSLAWFQSFNLSSFHHSFLIIFVIGIASTALVVAIPVLSAYYLYLSLALMPMTAWLLAQYPGIDSVIGGLGIFFLGLLFLAGRGLNRHLVNTIRFKFENLDLAGEIKQLNDNLELHIHEKTQALFESEERFNLAMMGANDGLWDWDIVNNVAYFSPRWKAMLGYSELELGEAPKEWRRRVHPEDLRKVLAAMRDHLRGRSESYESIHRIQHKDGHYLWVLDRARAVFDENGNPYRMVGTQVDISHQKKLEEKFKQANINLKYEIKERILAQNELAHLAKHDPLTNLPNRILFYEQLKEAVHRAEIEGDAIAVLLVDLDNFKHVNDTLGHPVGDRLLVDVSKRLTAIVNKNYFLSRFGGDEFLVVLEGCSDTFLVDAYAKEIIELISKPFYLDNQEIRIGSSIGITLFPEHGKEPDKLIRDADIAMYHAKDQGRNTYRYFTEEMDQKISERARLRNLLHGVMDRNELEVYYQPQIDIESGKVCGIEALLRWNSEEAGAIGPDKFIPLLEEIGLISQVGKWVLEQACGHAYLLQKKGLRNFKMSVNVSPRQFLYEGLVRDIEMILEKTGLSAKVLEIEITENIFMEDLELVRQALSSLQDLGVSITLDDFGTGYSSLGYLKRFPINGVKIDKVFIRDLLKNNDSLQLVTAIIAMAKGLNMTTMVAEGVETETQLQALRNAGCRAYQGFYYSQPLPYLDLEKNLFPGYRLKSI